MHQTGEHDRDDEARGDGRAQTEIRRVRLEPRNRHELDEVKRETGFAEEDEGAVREKTDRPAIVILGELGEDGEHARDGDDSMGDVREGLRKNSEVKS